jgi:hypothetical protein
MVSHDSTTWEKTRSEAEEYGQPLDTGRVTHRGGTNGCIEDSSLAFRFRCWPMVSLSSLVSCVKQHTF